MFQAAILFLASFATWLLIEQRFGVAELGVAALVGLACALLTARVVGFGGSAIASAPRVAWMQAARSGAAFGGAFAIAREALARTKGLRPALVRARVRVASAEGLAACASVVGADARTVVVSVGEDGLLLHVNDEHAQHLSDLKSVESKIRQIFGERAEG